MRGTRVLDTDVVFEHLQSQEPHDVVKTLRYRASPLEVLTSAHSGAGKVLQARHFHRPDRRAYRELKSHSSQPASQHTISVSPQAQIPSRHISLEFLLRSGKSRGQLMQTVQTSTLPNLTFPAHGWMTILIRSSLAGRAQAR